MSHRVTATLLNLLPHARRTFAGQPQASFRLSVAKTRCRGLWLAAIAGIFSAHETFSTQKGLEVSHD